MIRFIDTTTVIRHTLEQDADEQKTVFLIVPLTSQEIQVVNDATMDFKTNGVTTDLKVKQSLRYRLIVQLGLRGWENAPKDFVTEQRSILGLPKREIIKEELLNLLPIDYIVALAEKIQDISISTGTDPKN